MFRRTLISAAIKILDTFLVSKITYAPAKVYVKENYDRLKRVADILTDKNPDNQQQLRELWETEKLDLISDTIALKKEIISKEIRDEVIKEALLDLIETIEKTLQEQLALEAPKSAKDNAG